MIKAGELNKRITIENYTPLSGLGQSLSGSYKRAWSTYITVWAKVEETGGSETDADDVMLAVSTAKITIRKDTSNPVDATMRIDYDGYYWDITSVTEVGFNEGYEIIARKRDNKSS
jgi:SPP1 family predicted phage head-tail adaptor